MNKKNPFQKKCPSSYRLLYFLFINFHSIIYLDPCPDNSLLSLTNRFQLIHDGWILDLCDDSIQCPIPSSSLLPLSGQINGPYIYYGLKPGLQVGRVTYKFKGFGKAKLVFGNCAHFHPPKQPQGPTPQEIQESKEIERSSVMAYLNYQINSMKIAYWQQDVTFEFLYEPGDILYIEEKLRAVLVIHSFHLECEGKTI